MTEMPPANGCQEAFLCYDGCHMQKQCILFDFDGVIIDSFNECLSVIRLSRPWISQDEFRDLFMGNLYDKLMETKEMETREIVPLSAEEFFKHYFEFSKKLGVIDGMAGVIERLAATHRLSIVSSAYNFIIEELLERAQLRHHFSDILGADDETNKTKKIQAVFEKYGVTADESYFITDTAGDVLEARHAGVDSIAVSWGYHGIDRLVAAAPYAIVHTPEELFNTISNI